MNHSRMTRTEVISCYLSTMLVWALFGAFVGWALPTGAFVYVGHTEGIPVSMSLFQWDGFLTVTCALGAFIGGATGIEAGQEKAYKREMSMRMAAQRHPSVR